MSEDKAEVAGRLGYCVNEQFSESLARESRVEAALDWRKTFGFDQEDVSFAEVQKWYRDKMLEANDLERVQALSEA